MNCDRCQRQVNNRYYLRNKDMEIECYLCESCMKEFKIWLKPHLELTER